MTPCSIPTSCGAPTARGSLRPVPPINSLTLAELKRYDVGRIKPGSKYAQQFPEQQPVDGARIPTLAELFDLAKSSGKTPRFNIETKLSPDKPDEAPDPETFARLVVEAVRAAGLSEPHHHPIVRLAHAASLHASSRPRSRPSA